MSTAHEQLRALLQRYAHAADERDIETLAGLFHPDAEISGTRGVQGLHEWLEAMRGPRAFPLSMHFIGDPLIELAPGEQEGRLDSYAVVYQLSDRSSDNRDLTLGIRYVDLVVVYRGAWVFKQRTSTTLWMR